MNIRNSKGDFFRLNPFLDMLRRELSKLSIEHMVAFALYCCERLYPFYESFARKIGSSGTSVLQTLIDELWQCLHAGCMNQEQFEQFYSRLQEIDLSEEGCCNEWDGAVDAVGAVSLTLEAWRDESAESAAKAAGNVLNRVHQRLMDEAVGSTYLLSVDEIMMLNRRIEQHSAIRCIQEQLLKIVRDLKKQQTLTVSDVQKVRALAKADRQKVE